MKEALPLERSGRFLWLRPSSIRSQLIIYNAMMLVLLFLLLGLILHFAVRTILIGSVDRELRMRTQGIADHAQPPGGPGPPDGPGAHSGESPGREFPGPGGGPPEDAGGRPPGDGPPGAPPEPPDRSKYRPRVYDRAGRLLERNTIADPWDRDALARALQGSEIYSTVQFGDEPIRVLSRPFPRLGAMQGVIQAPYPLRDVWRAVAVVNLTLLLLFPVALLGTVLAGTQLTRHALQPVRRITEAAQRMSARDLSQRLPEHGHDEFAQLSGTFNEMLQRLQISFEEQEKLVQRLRDMVEQQRRFTADASHELRTPLTAIKANTSLCLSGNPTPDDYRQSLGDIDSAATAMSGLVNDLLLLARSDGGQLGRNRIALPMREAVERALALIPRDKNSTAAIQVQIPDAALAVFGNEAEIVRLFTNLLGNAVKYTPPEGCITVTAAAGDMVRVTIADTGPGIAPEHLAHLGERFYRVETSRARAEGGTGLGLSICKGIVDAHGGTIAFQSKLGVGTRVTVSLPGAGGE